VQSLLPGLAALACPLGMSLMMWTMTRGKHKNVDDGTQQVEQLRTEIEQLKAERAGSGR
jgi:hypothetical protein